MKNNLKGITLIETIIYIGIFALFLPIVMNFMLSTQESTRRNNYNLQLSKSVEFISEHLDYSFEKVKSIKEEDCIFNEDRGVLVLNTTNETVSYTVSNSKIYYNTTPITPSNMSITQFRIEPIYNHLNIATGVRIFVALQSKHDPSMTTSFNLLENIR